MRSTRTIVISAEELKQLICEKLGVKVPSRDITIASSYTGHDQLAEVTLVWHEETEKIRDVYDR